MYQMECRANATVCAFRLRHISADYQIGVQPHLLLRTH